MVKKILSFTSKSLFIFTTLVALYFLTAFAFSRITVNNTISNNPEINIYVMTNGIHTDIVVPAITAQKDWTQEVKYSNTKSADSTYNYLALGWGDRKFYLETPEFSDLKISTALGAITGLSSTAMHTTYYKNIVEDKSCKKIKISQAQYTKLIDYLSTSFKSDLNGYYTQIKTNMNYGNADAFYEAVGSYSLFKTCNTWANSALKVSGQKACLWTIFDTGIFLKYE